MISNRLLYWVLQVSGWGVFAGMNLFVSYFQNGLIPELYVYSVSLFFFGILVSHGYRHLVRNQNWLQLGIVHLLIRSVLAAPLLSFVYTLLIGAFSDLFLPNVNYVLRFDSFSFWGPVFNFSILFVLWSILYFSFHFIRNYQRAEIRNLQLLAANTEIELKNVRNQLNPHFIFNAMNSIRALIDEDPEKAKDAVILLSGIMRNTLNFGKKNLISLEEELDLVKKYLEMEKIRFEERLHFNIDIEANCLALPFPPFMLQTIVENAVKHGISKINHGGNILISGSMSNHLLIVRVANNGQLKPADNQGIGLINTKQRLQLLFGEQARFSIENQEDMVVAKIEIPLSQIR